MTVNRSKWSIARIIMMLCGVVLSAFGMAMYYFSAMGSDPVSVFVDGLHVYYHIGYGKVVNGFNAVVLVTVLLFARKEIGIGMVISLLCTGTLLDGFLYVLQSNYVQTGIVSECVTFLIGIICLTFGTALFLESGLGAGPWDTVLVTISKLLNTSFRYVRMCSDAFFTAVGYFLGGVVGVGTVLSVMSVGILVDLFRLFIRRCTANSRAVERSI